MGTDGNQTTSNKRSIRRLFITALVVCGSLFWLDTLSRFGDTLDHDFLVHGQTGATQDPFVIVFDSSGQSRAFTSDVPNLAQIAGPCNGTWDRCITRVTINGSVNLYSGANYTGSWIGFAGTNAAIDLTTRTDGPSTCGGNWSRCISSMHIRRSVQDNRADALPLRGFPGSVTASNRNATCEAGFETDTSRCTSVWWEWVAPSDGIFAFYTEGSTFDTFLMIYEAGTTNRIAFDDNCSPGVTSWAAFTATQGRVYWIGVTGKNNASGDIRLRWFRTLPVPTATVTNATFGTTVESGQQHSVRVSLSASNFSTYGLLFLTFTPTAANPAVDPAMVFSNGDTRIDFETFSVNPTFNNQRNTSASFQTGSIGGTITLEPRLFMCGSNVEVRGTPLRTTIADRAPTIRSVTFTRQTSSSLDFSVMIEGFSTSRELSQAVFNFTGQNVDTSSIAVDVSSAFTTWYRSSASTPYGSLFRLRVPFTSNLAMPSGIVTVQLRNRIGTTSGSASY